MKIAIKKIIEKCMLKKDNNTEKINDSLIN